MSGKLGSTRRDFLKVASAGSLLSCGPYIHAQPKPKLRVLGIENSMHEATRLRAQEDLGIDIEYVALDNAQVLQHLLTTPDSYDVISQSINYTNFLWESKVIQSIDARRLRHWDEVDPLHKTGHVAEGSSIGAGDASYKINFVQPDGSRALEQTELLRFVPSMGSVTGFAYNTDVIAPGVPYETESWSWLLDRQYSGQVCMMNDPSTAIFNLALAAQASGLMQIDDTSAMTREEVDRLLDIIIQLKSEGHFSAVWTSISDSIDFFNSGRVAIGSIYPIAVYGLRSLGVNIRHAAPKEGYRGWQAGIYLSARTEGRQKDIAYEYMDWWLSGWMGAYASRMGYYTVTPKLSRPWLSPAEWDYWYEGKPAAEDLRGVDNQTLIPAGDARNGGSYQDRMSRVAVWNTIMPAYDYIIRRWYEMLAIF